MEVILVVIGLLVCLLLGNIKPTKNKKKIQEIGYKDFKKINH